jgi:hypothetical protein
MKADPWPKDKSTGKIPLYAPSVLPLLISSLFQHTLQQLGRHDQVVSDLEFVLRFLGNTESHTRITKTPVQKSKLDSHAIATLRNIGIIEETQTDLPSTTVAFLVKEKRKGTLRHRTIFHTIVDNNTGPKEGTMKVAPIEMLGTRLRACRFAATRDFKSFFHQLSFTPPVADFFIFNVGNQKFKLLRAAMGHKNSPAAATAVTKSLTILAINGARDTFPSFEFEVKYDIIIDDVLFASQSKEVLQHVLKAFDSICDQFRVTIGSKTDPNETVTHRGIMFNLNSKTQSLKSEFIEKFKERTGNYNTRPNNDKARSLLGMISYAAQVIHVPKISEAYRNFIGTIFTQKISGQEFHCVQKDIIQNVPRPLPTSPGTPSAGTICSDATPLKIAAMYIDQHGNINTSTDALTEETPIHIAEAMATLLSLKLLPKYSITHSITVISDNLTWLYTVRKTGRITTPQLEHIRNCFTQSMLELNLVPIFQYITSAQNPTDALSRHSENLSWTSEQVNRMIDTAQALDDLMAK